MAKVSFDNITEPSSSNSGNNVEFFLLKNDGDEAVVRFMHDTVDDFDIMSVHNVEINGRYRKVNCIRDPYDNLDKCPLCAANVSLSQRFFIHMIQYVREGDKMVPKPVVWERSTAYAKTLKSYIDNYGPLSDVICKVIRHGAAGDMKTTYEIVPNLSKQVYPDEVFIKDTTLFNNFNVLGSIVMDKTPGDMNVFLSSGVFPETKKADDQVVPRGENYGATAQPAFSQPSPVNTANPNPVEQPSQQPYYIPQTQSFGQNVTPTPNTFRQPQQWESNQPNNVNQGIERPLRQF